MAPFLKLSAPGAASKALGRRAWSWPEVMASRKDPAGSWRSKLSNHFSLRKCLEDRGPVDNSRSWESLLFFRSLKSFLKSILSFSCFWNYFVVRVGNLSTCQWLSLAMQNQNHDVKYSSSCFKSSTKMQEKSTSHLLSTWCFLILNRTPQTKKKHLYAWDIFSLAFCNWPAVTPSGGLMVAETKVPFHTEKKRTVGTSKGHKSPSFLDIGFFGVISTFHVISRPSLIFYSSMW